MKSLVRDVLTTEVVTVEPLTPFREIVTRLAQHRISAVPVVDSEGRVLGVVTEADLLLKQEHPDPKLNLPLAWSRRRRRERAKAAAVVAGELMTTPPVTVAPTATVTEAARRIHTAAVKRLPAVDEAGRLVGIVSRADLLKVFTRPDKAIWREILDDVIVGQFTMDPDRFLVHVNDGVVVLQGRAERRSLIPFLVRATRAVEGVIRVENRLSFDVDDHGPGMPMVSPWMGPRALGQGDVGSRGRHPGQDDGLARRGLVLGGHEPVGPPLGGAHLSRVSATQQRPGWGSSTARTGGVSPPI
jgi:CBS domain-containing protein